MRRTVQIVVLAVCLLFVWRGWTFLTAQAAADRAAAARDNAAADATRTATTSKRALERQRIRYRVIDLAAANLEHDLNAAGEEGFLLVRIVGTRGVMVHKDDVAFMFPAGGSSPDLDDISDLLHDREDYRQ